MAKSPPESSSPAEPRRVRAPKKAGPASTGQPARASDTVEEGNFIQLDAGEAGGGRSPNTLTLSEKAGKAAQTAAEQAKKESGARDRTLRVPDSVQERFIQIGNRFHFPDGTEAFKHEGNRLTTRSENAVVIQSMVAIAREYGSGPVTVGGSEFFRKEAWFAASLVGLSVQGYQPNEFERERLARALAARRGPGAPEVEVSPADARAPSKTRRPDKATPPKAPSDEVIMGRLIDHGAAPYGHDPKQAMSYFVRIETARGDREIWGVDLERAFRQSLSTPGIGDEIGLRAVGSQAVTVLTRQLDAEGRETGTMPLETHRNQWIVERKSFLEERQRMAEVLRDSTLSAADAIRRHPELEGSYLQLQLGRALAEKQFRDRAQREQFVDHLRAHIAQRIEHGQALEPVMLRGEDRSVSPRSQDRDYEPTR